MSVVIQPMAEADLAAVLAIDAASFDPYDPTVRERQLREELARAWARLRVAREGDAVLAYILFWHVVDEVHLLNVAVAATSRRRGIGRALVADLLDYARTHAVVKVLLEVRASNAPALALYEAFGFERFHVRSAYYPDGEDGVEMLLRISD